MKKYKLLFFYSGPLLLLIRGIQYQRKNNVQKGALSSYKYQTGHSVERGSFRLNAF